jgi:hypothetical protein
MWREAVMTKSKVPSWYLSVGTEGNHKNSSFRILGVQTEIRNKRLSQNKTEALPVEPTFPEIT